MAISRSAVPTRTVASYWRLLKAHAAVYSKYRGLVGRAPPVDHPELQGDPRPRCPAVLLYGGRYLDRSSTSFFAQDASDFFGCSGQLQLQVTYVRMWPSLMPCFAFLEEPGLLLLVDLLPLGQGLEGCGIHPERAPERRRIEVSSLTHKHITRFGSNAHNSHTQWTGTSCSL